MVLHIVVDLIDFVEKQKKDADCDLGSNVQWDWRILSCVHYLLWIINEFKGRAGLEKLDEVKYEVMN